MRFMMNYYGEVFKNKYLTSTCLCSLLNKRNLSSSPRFKMPARKLSTELKKSHRNLNQDFYHVLAKTDALYSSNFVRNLLYPETDDEIILQLKSCYDLGDVVRIIDTNKSLSNQQLNQVVLVLRDLQTLLDLHQVLMDDEHPIRLFRNSQTFRKLLSLIESNISNMNANEISCTLLYLNKLNVKFGEPVMVKLIDACEKSMFTTDKTLVLQNLSRFFITVKEQNNIWALYTMSQYLPFLLESLDTCENHNDFRHITVCFQKCVPLLNPDILNKYVAKLDFILHQHDENNDATEKTRMILKAIVFLNFKHWSSLYINEVKRLMAIMKDKLHHLCLKEVSLLHKAAVSLQEPYDLWQGIEKMMNNYIKAHHSEETQLSTVGFQALFPGVKLIGDDDLKNRLIKYFKRNSVSYNISIYFNDIHNLIFGTNLKLDKTITTAYWSILANLLGKAQREDTEQFMEYLMLCVHRYIHLIGTQKTFRNDIFEKSLVSCIICILRDDHFICSPANYTKLALTVLALSSRNPFHFLNEAVLQKLLDHLPRLNLYDTLFVSAALRIASERFTNRRQGVERFLSYYVHLNAAANANTSHNLRYDSTIPPEGLNTMLFSYVLTKGIRTTEIFGEICNRFQRVKIHQLHSKIIRDSVFNFNMCEHLVPEYTDVIVEYCVKEKNAVFGNTVAILLNYCFLFGYVPEKLDEFLTISASIIDRDKEFIPKSTYLQSALALSFFRELPTSWSDYIFNLKFLELLDGHLNRLNFKKNNTLRRKLMELNRVVCIDYPHREIPWFHEKYCQEIITLERQIPNEFLTSVENVVRSLIKTDEAIDTNYISPYGHKIDLVLHLNEDDESTDTNQFNPTKQRKIAMILKSNPPSTYYKGKGKLELFSHQLEMLNFEVISLSKQEWNAMYMSSLEEKTNFLRTLIWPA